MLVRCSARVWTSGVVFVEVNYTPPRLLSQSLPSVPTHLPSLSPSQLFSPDLSPSFADFLSGIFLVVIKFLLFCYKIQLGFRAWPGHGVVGRRESRLLEHVGTSGVQHWDSAGARVSPCVWPIAWERNANNPLFFSHKPQGRICLSERGPSFFNFLCFFFLKEGVCTYVHLYPVWWLRTTYVSVQWRFSPLFSFTVVFLTTGNLKSQTEFRKQNKIKHIQV